jgi:nucleoporin POM152
VKDAICPGVVLESSSTFEVDFKPRPQVALVQSSAIKQTGGVHRHKGLCAGEEDQVGFRFKGGSPPHVWIMRGC